MAATIRVFPLKARKKDVDAGDKHAGDTRMPSGRDAR
jgi:hypothetical protein